MRIYSQHYTVTKIRKILTSEITKKETKKQRKKEKKRHKVHIKARHVMVVNTDTPCDFLKKIFYM